MANSFRNIPGGEGNLIVPTVGDLPLTAPTGTIAVVANTSDIYVFDGTSWQLKTASGSAGVASFNGRSGVVVPLSGDYDAADITYNNTISGLTATDVQDAIDELAAATITFPILAPDGNAASPSYGFVSDTGQDTGMFHPGDGILAWSTNASEAMTLTGNDLNVVGNITAANFPQTGDANTLAIYDLNGDQNTIPEFGFDPNLFNRANWVHGIVPDATNNFNTIHNIYASYNPTVPNSKQGFNHLFIEAGIGTDDSGNQVGDYTDVKATLVEADITFTANRRGADGNVVSIEFTGGGTAGSEHLTVDGTLLQYTLQIANGVSTATQIVAAIAAQVGSLGNNITAVVTGTGSNPQNTFAQTFLAGGIYDEGGINLISSSFYSRNKSNVGFVTGHQLNVDFGNGTDPIHGNNVTLYNANLNLHDNASFQSLAGINLNFGASNTNSIIHGDVRGFSLFGQMQDIDGNFYGYQTGLNFRNLNSITSFQASPQISGNITHSVNTFADFSNYNGDIGDNYYGVTIQPNINTVDGITGFNFTPNITLSRQNSYGLNVNMNNITGYPGVQASVVIQDLTLIARDFGSGGNSIQIDYANDGTAGSETATLVGNTITVHMQSGVSTATQIRTAFLANVVINANLIVNITGTGSNPQISETGAMLAGGIDKANIYAANLNGDVTINGSLQSQKNFTTGIDTLQFVYGMSNIGGNFHVASGHPIVGGQFGILNNFGIGIQIEDDVNPDSTGLNLGTSMVGILTQVGVAAGKTMDSLNFTATAASIPFGSGNLTNVAMFRAIGLIPQGGTLNITNMYGFKIEALLSATSPTNCWGFFNDDGNADNYFAKNLAIGTLSKKVSNSSIALEIGSVAAIRFANMTTAQKLGLTALPGMQVFDTDLTQMSYYNGTSWINF